MTITDIENLSFVELKANRAELIAAVKECTIQDLSARYIQARTDAKQRDERMAEMGKEITGLQDEVNDLRDKIESATKRWDEFLRENQTKLFELEHERDVAKRQCAEAINLLARREAESVLS